jgi:hypothetical protein
MGFWAKQFEPNRTSAQDAFDVVFGLVLPILCLVADPVVFKSFPLFGPAILEDYQLLAYVVCTVEMGFFLVWRTFPKRVTAFSPLFAGVFLIGACFSIVIGLAMLPVTLLTILLVIGLLGLLPFVSAFVYLRNGVRALKAQPNYAPLVSRLWPALLSGFFVVVPLFFTTVCVERAISASVDTMIYGNATQAEAAANRLRRFPFIPLKHSNRLAEAYGQEWDDKKKAMLAVAYWEITGEDVDRRQRMMAD